MGLVINKFATSWDKSIITFGNTTQTPTIRSLDYGSKVVAEKQWGASQIPYGWTDGHLDLDEIKVEVAPSDWYNLFTGLGGKAAMLSAQAVFNLSVSYTVDPFQLIPYTDTLYSCRILNVQGKLAENNASMFELTLGALDISFINPGLNIVPPFGLVPIPVTL